MMTNYYNHDDTDTENCGDNNLVDMVTKTILLMVTN